MSSKSRPSLLLLSITLFFAFASSSSPDGIAVDTSLSAPQLHSQPDPPSIRGGNLISQVASESNSTASAGSFSDVSPSELGMPAFPKYLRAKLRVWLPKSTEPMLVVYHYDSSASKTREDYFYMKGVFHKRSLTVIKDYNKAQETRIIHKAPRSPRMCYIVPVSSSMPTTFFLRAARFVGIASVTLTNNIHSSVSPSADKSEGSTSDKKDASAKKIERPTVKCEQWSMMFDGEETQVCLDTVTRVPVIIQHPVARVEVLHWDAMSSPSQSDSRGDTPLKHMPHWKHVFDTKRASKAKCLPFM